MITAILIGAGQRGAFVYGEYAKKHPEEFKVVAVAEPLEERRTECIQTHGISPDRAFTDWRDLLALGKIADCAMVCTQDRFHLEPVRESLRQGYHVMCEKPMSPNPEECVAMGEYAKQYKKTLTVCHVLRYSPFYSALKNIIDSQVIGDIINIQHLECVGYWHQAHSFVRGNWRNSKSSSPMILQKSCHDMDILAWLTGKKCRKVSSFGALTHFKKENAPKGAARYCMGGCKARSQCPYDAVKIYLEQEEWYSETIRKVVALVGTNEAVSLALKEGPYGRCVYDCDNDVVDHQVVNLEYEDGVTASFTMCAFTGKGSRVMNIMGTRGQILGDMEENTIEVLDFLTGNSVKTTVKTGNSGHSGSDDKFMEGFLKTVQTDGAYSLSGAEVSVESHLVALAAEESRVTGKTIVMDEYRKKIAERI